MKDIPDILDDLKRSGPILSEFVKSIPADKMNLRRGEGFWTIAIDKRVVRLETIIEIVEKQAYLPNK